MSLPLISIVVPVYKAQDYLEECIESLRAQTYTNMEIILVDDGSPDKSGELCDRLAEKDARIRVIHQQNQGASAARNHGIQSARGELLLLVDADDTVFPEYVETLYREMDGQDMVICGYRICYPKYSKEVCVKAPVSLENISGCEQQVMQIYSERLLNSPWNKMYRKTLVFELFDPTLVMGEDLVFNLNYLKNAKKVKVTDKVLYNYMVRENSAVTSYKPNRMNNVIRIAQFLLDYFSEVFETSVCHAQLVEQGLKEVDAVFRHLFRGGNTKDERASLVKHWCEDEGYRAFCEKYVPKDSILLKDPETVYRYYNKKTWLERKIIKLLS